jgi:hypothetical protein
MANQPRGPTQERDFIGPAVGAGCLGPSRRYTEDGIRRSGGYANASTS